MQPKNKPLRYIAYIRKSEERKERQELSHKAQRRKIEEQFPELNIIEWVEESKSAFKPGRPLFDQVIEKIKSGEADAIVSWHPNRISRNEIDAATVTYALRTTKELKDIKFCAYTFENNPEGIMMLQIIMSQSQYESSKQARDVSKGMAQKAMGGERPGQVPQGYIKLPLLNDNGDVIRRKGDKIITYTGKDPERYELVKLMWRMFLYEGYSPNEIWRIATYEWGFVTRKTTFKENSPGGKPMSKSMIYKIFTNRFYAGEILHNGEWHKGKHEAMVSLEEFDYAQKLLGSKGRPRKTARNFAYGSMLRCGVCNCQIVAKATTKLIKGTGELKTYIHYYCTRKSLNRPCTQVKYTTVEELEKNIDAELAKYTIIPEFRDMALRILRRNLKSEVKDRTTIYESQQDQRKNIQGQLDKLLDRLTRDVIDEDAYVRQSNQLKAQLVNLDGKLRSTEKRAEDWLELTEKAFDFATYARIRFNETDDPRIKRDILQTLGVDLLLTDNRLSLTPKSWLTPIEKDYPSLEKAYLKVRTNKKASPTDIEEAISQIMISWRAI
jgi:site-specific DNA recombinase